MQLFESRSAVTRNMNRTRALVFNAQTIKIIFWRACRAHLYISPRQTQKMLFLYSCCQVVLKMLSNTLKKHLSINTKVILNKTYLIFFEIQFHFRRKWNWKEIRIHGRVSSVNVSELIDVKIKIKHSKQSWHITLCYINLNKIHSFLILLNWVAAASRRSSNSSGEKWLLSGWQLLPRNLPKSHILNIICKMLRLRK